jgi:hypothetical protein
LGREYYCIKERLAKQWIPLLYLHEHISLLTASRAKTAPLLNFFSGGRFINELIDRDKIDTMDVERFPLIIKLLLSGCSISSVTSSMVANVSVSIESTGSIRLLFAPLHIVTIFIPCDVVAMIKREIATKPHFVSSVVWTTKTKIMHRYNKIITPIIDA